MSGKECGCVTRSDDEWEGIWLRIRSEDEWEGIWLRIRSEDEWERIRLSDKE